MTRTKEEFVKRWRAIIAGMALFGVASETRDGPLLRASKVLDIPGEVEALLRRMYDDLTYEPPLEAGELAKRKAAETVQRNGVKP